MELRIRIGKKTIVTTLILAVILAAYNVLYFVIPYNRDLSNAAMWITYGVTTFLTAFSAVTVCIGIYDKELKSRVLGIPILYLGYGVLVAQFVIDTVITAVGSRFEVGAWVAAVVETLLLAFFFISLIARTAYKDTIKKIDEKEYKESFIRELRPELKLLVDSVNDGEVKTALNKLCETVLCTDPVSSKFVIEIEDEISEKIKVLKESVAAGDDVKSLNLIRETDLLVKERKLKLRG